MDGDAVKPEDQGDIVPGAQLTDEQKEFHQKVKDAGWTEKTAFNYDEYQRTGGENAEDFGGMMQIYNVDWNDDYGDVGPELPELEKGLFGGEFRNRKGEHLAALQLEANVEGPSNKRIRKVIQCMHFLGRYSKFS